MIHCSCKNHYRAMPPSNRVHKVVEILLPDVPEVCFDCIAITNHQLPNMDRSITVGNDYYNRVVYRTTCVKDWQCAWCNETISKGTPYVDSPLSEPYYYETSVNKVPLPSSIRFHHKCYVEFKCARTLLFPDSYRIPNKSELRALLMSTVKITDLQLAAIENLEKVRPSRKLFSSEVMEYFKKFSPPVYSYL